jgi:hypothetical protein
VLGEGIPDPLERVVVQAGQIDPESLGAKRVKRRGHTSRPLRLAKPDPVPQ